MNIEQPNSPEAEEATLGSCLLDPLAIPLVRETLTPADFYRAAHGAIFSAILSLVDKGSAVDLLTLTAKLEAEGILERVGGAAGVSRLTTVTPSSANVLHYAGLVREASEKRRLLRLAANIEIEAVKPSVMAAEIMAQAAEGLREATRANDPRGQLLTVAQIMEYPEIEYLVEPFAPVGALVNLTAYTGIGKTIFVCQLALATMTGLPFLGKFKVHRQGTVLYFDEETPRSYLKDRLGKMGFRAEDPFFVAHFSGLKLDNDRDFQLIKDLVTKKAPRLVIFDTLIRFHTADENSASEMALVMGRLREIANMGPCVYVLIHQNKSGADMRVRSRGSSDIIGACDLELSITPQDHGLLTVQSVKARMAPVPPVTLKIEAVEGMLSIAIASEWSDELTTAVDEILREAEGGISITGVTGKLHEQGLEVSRSTVVRLFNEDEGHYTFSPGPRKVKLFRVKEEE